MSYSVEGKIVLAISSSALFDMTECDGIFREKGLLAYKEHQKKNIDVPLPKGVAFPFVSRLLKMNDDFPSSRPVEVIMFKPALSNAQEEWENYSECLKEFSNIVDAKGISLYIADLSSADAVEGVTETILHSPVSPLLGSLASNVNVPLLY